VDALAASSDVISNSSPHSMSKEAGMAGSWAPWVALGLLVVREVAAAVIQHFSHRALERLTSHIRPGHGKDTRTHDDAASRVVSDAILDDPMNRRRSELPTDPIQLRS
jgi:hypothetical protein